MFKKIYAIILVIAMCLSICACNNNSNHPTTGNNSDSGESNTTKPADNTATSIPTDETLDTEQELGDWNDLPVEKKREYKTMIVNAVIALDIEVLSKHLKDDSLNTIQRIYDNEKYREMWKKTIGLSIYLPESEAIVMKDTDYVFHKWYTDCYENNNLPDAENLRDLPMSEIDSLYEKYYKDAPYTANDCSVGADIVDGVVKFGINSIFEDIHVYNLHDLDPFYDSESNGHSYAQFIFGENESAYPALGFDHINKDGDFPTWEAVYKFDLNAMDEIIKQNPDILSGVGARYYEDYFKDPDLRDDIVSWVTENCEILRGVSDVWIYTKPILGHEKEIYDSHPYKQYTEEEIAMIKDLDLVIHFYHNGWSTAFDAYNLGAHMLALGVID